MEQELLTLLEHLSSPPVFSGIRVARSFTYITVVGFIGGGNRSTLRKPQSY